MKKNNIQEALKDFSRAQKILQEDYGFGPEEEQGMMPQGPQEMPQQEMPQQDIAHYRGNEGGAQQQMNPEDQNTDMNLSKSDERIAQIREVALDGLQDYAEDVDSEAYQFYKKIWLMCDKAVSEKDSAGNGGSGE